MDFSVSEELASVQQLAQQILKDFTAPEQLKLIDEQEQRFDAALWQALADAGLLALDIEAAHGGTDLGFSALAALCEEVGRTAAPVPGWKCWPRRQAHCAASPGRRSGTSGCPASPTAACC